MVDGLKIEVCRADGQKCPRCWMYAGIPENPHGICDRCAKTMLDSTPEDFAKNIDPEKFEAFRVAFVDLQREIKACYAAQAEKYMRR